MKAALLLYTSGLGDCIQITPQLRILSNQGYIVDLMCRKAVKTSALFDNCPYIDKILTAEVEWDYWDSGGYDAAVKRNHEKMLSISDGYDWVKHREHKNVEHIPKTIMNSLQLDLPISNLALEVFMIEDNGTKALDWIHRTNHFGKYTFVHYGAEGHPIHEFTGADEWIKDNLPAYPIVTENTMYDDNRRLCDVDINIVFQIIMRAEHRVLGCGCYVHAADAMGVTIDAVSYGNKNHKVWPIDMIKVRNLREEGKWLKKDGKWTENVWGYRKGEA